MKTITKLSIKSVVFISCMSVTLLMRGMKNPELQSASSASSSSSNSSSSSAVSSVSAEEKLEERPLDCVDLIPETKALVLGYLDGWQEHTRLTTDIKDIRSIAYSPNGNYLACKGFNDYSADKIVLWDTKRNTKESYHRYKRFMESFSYSSLAYSPDGKHLAFSTRGFSIEIWDTRDWVCITELIAPCRELSMAYSPDGSHLVAGGGNGTITIWDTKDWKSADILKQSNRIYSVAYSRDGSYLAVTDYKDIKIWDTCNWHCVKTITGNSRKVVALAYSPDDKHLASSGRDDGIKIWDTTDWSCIKTLADCSSDGSAIYSIAYSSDGNYLIAQAGTSYRDRGKHRRVEIVKIWNVKDWSCIPTLSDENKKIEIIACSSDGVYLASYASSDDHRELSCIRSETVCTTYGIIKIWKNQMIELSKPLSQTLQKAQKEAQKAAQQSTKEDAQKEKNQATGEQSSWCAIS